jgi:hypothetical protein
LRGQAAHLKTINIFFLKYGGVSIITHGEKNYLVSRVCKGSNGRELFLGKPEMIPTMQNYRLNASVVLL